MFASLHRNLSTDREWYQNPPRTQNQRGFLLSHHGNAKSLSPPRHRLCFFDHPHIPCKPRSRNIHRKLKRALCISTGWKHVRQLFTANDLQRVPSLQNKAKMLAKITNKKTKDKFSQISGRPRMAYHVIKYNFMRGMRTITHRSTVVLSP